MSFLNQYLIYRYNDMSLFFVKNLGLYTGRTYLNIPDTLQLNVDLLNKALNYLVFMNFHPVLGSNLLLVFYIVLNFYFAFRLFRKLTDFKEWALMFSLMFALSNFFLFRLISQTNNLYQIFFFPLIFEALISQRKRTLKIALLLVFFFLFSSYLAYFCLLFVCFWYLAEVLSLPKNSYYTVIKKNLQSLSIIILTLILSLFVFYPSVLVNNISLFKNEKVSQIYTNPGKIVNRPIEDFFAFSTRPWYFVIPPKSSLLFGSMSQNIYNRLESTGNYLADDYSEYEAGGSYIGWHLLAGVVALVLLYYRKKLTDKEKEFTLRILLVLGLLLLISFPPYISISGLTLYFPSYIFFKMIPFFRALIRLSSLIYFLVLVLNLILINNLYKSIAPRFKMFLLILFGFLHFSLMVIKLPLVSIASPPPEVAFLDSLPESSLAVFPYGDYYSIFWVMQHKHFLINPKVAVFPYMRSTEKPTFDEFLILLADYEVHYIVYYKGSPDYSIEEVTDFLESSFGKKVFEDNSAIIFEQYN